MESRVSSMVGKCPELYLQSQEYDFFRSKLVRVYDEWGVPDLWIWSAHKIPTEQRKHLREDW